MNRFDDKLSWRFVEKIIAPVLAALLAVAGASARYENRVTKIETRQDTEDARLERMENKIDRLLERRGR